MVTVNGGGAPGEPTHTVVNLPYAPQLNVTDETFESRFSEDLTRIEAELALYEAAIAQLNGTNNGYEGLLDEARTLAQRSLASTRTRVSEGYDEQDEHRTVVREIELAALNANKNYHLLLAKQNYAALLTTLEQAQTSLRDLIGRMADYHPVYNEAGEVIGRRNSQQQAEWLQSEIERLEEQYDEAAMQNNQALMGSIVSELITLEDYLQRLTNQADCINEYSPNIQISEFEVGSEPTVMTITTEFGNTFRVCLNGQAPIGRTQTAGHEWHADVRNALNGVSSDLEITDEVLEARREANNLEQRAERATSGTRVDLSGERRTAEDIQGPIIQVPDNARR